MEKNLQAEFSHINRELDACTILSESQDHRICQLEATLQEQILINKKLIHHLTKFESESSHDLKKSNLDDSSNTNSAILYSDVIKHSSSSFNSNFKINFNKHINHNEVTSELIVNNPDQESSS